MLYYHMKYQSIYHEYHQIGIALDRHWAASTGAPVTVIWDLFAASGKPKSCLCISYFPHFAAPIHWIFEVFCCFFMCPLFLAQCVRCTRINQRLYLWFAQFLQHFCCICCLTCAIFQGTIPVFALDRWIYSILDFLSVCLFFCHCFSFPSLLAQ